MKIFYCFMLQHAFCQWIQSARIWRQIIFCKTLLVRFVKNLLIFFGDHFIRHNTHGLIHLSDDAQRFGAIERFSACPFENYNGLLKNLAKRGNKQLEQIVKRISEIEQHHEPNIVEISNLRPEPHEFSLIHFDGPLPNGIAGRQFKQVVYQRWTLTCKPSDNVAVLSDATPILIDDFVDDKDGSAYVVGRTFENVRAFFKTPMDSRNLGTFKVSRINYLIEVWPLDSIRWKAIKISLSDDRQVISSLTERNIF